jgi:hypothetical protein
MELGNRIAQSRKPSKTRYAAFHLADELNQQGLYMAFHLSNCNIPKGTNKMVNKILSQENKIDVSTI